MHARVTYLSGCRDLFSFIYSGAIPKDFRILPDRIFLVRHAESEGNVDNFAYTTIPDSQVPLVSDRFILIPYSSHAII